MVKKRSWLREVLVMFKKKNFIVFFGERVVHPKYGEQFKANSYQKDQPTSETGLINYLSSDKFPGVGKKTAEKKLSTFLERMLLIKF